VRFGAGDLRSDVCLPVDLVSYSVFIGRAPLLHGGADTSSLEKVLSELVDRAEGARMGYGGGSQRCESELWRVALKRSACCVHVADVSAAH
jgi:hypothetical protein